MFGVDTAIEITKILLRKKDWNKNQLLQILQQLSQKEKHCVKNAHSKFIMSENLSGSALDL